MVGEECEPSLTTPMSLSQWSVFRRCLTFNSCLISQVFILIAKVRCSQLRLNYVGTIEDLSRHNDPLSKDQSLLLYSEELEVGGIVEYSESEQLWVARIDWSKIRELEEAVAMA